MKSLKFFKPTLATTLAIVMSWLLSVRPAQAGYTVTLQQVGPNVVATGSGAISLRGLSFAGSSSRDPAIGTSNNGAGIYTGRTSSSVDLYATPRGPTSFGVGVCFGCNGTSANSGSGDMVGIASVFYAFYRSALTVPRGYVSGTALSDTATYSGTTLATLGVTPGTYVWTWGTGANQNFTLQIRPAPIISNTLSNISTRLRVGTNDDVLIGGFIVGGTGPKQLLLRALGPTLTQFNVPGALANPTLELHDSTGRLLASNDNWGEAANAGFIPASLRPPNSLESAILTTLNPGAYTAIVRGVSGTTGVALVETYDVSPLATAHLTNFSTRGLVETDANVMIAGLIVQTGNQNVIVRALGPTLTGFNVPNALADPTLELRDANGALLNFNDNWKSTQQTQITATGKAPPNDLESAIVRTLAPGRYTAIVRGANNTTGVALVEVYTLP